jgi:DNA polymerase (family 10)
MEAVLKSPAVDRVLGQGDTKTSFVTARGTQVDVRVVKPSQLGAALLYFTGSKGHNIKLRQRALARGFTLNEYALARLDDGQVVASETEADIYAALGLPFIPPVLREDWGELEAAEQGVLPAGLGEPVGDFHLHTSLSGDGRSSLEEMVQGALALGHKVLAITDHAEGTLAGVGRTALLEQRDQIRALEAKLGGAIRLLHGVELNIRPDGSLDYDADFRSAFDWCVASVHDHFELDQEAQTRRIITAMRDPSVRLIGHPAARLIGGRPPIALDYAALFAAAEETGTALEVNGGLPRLDLSVEALRQARGRDVTFVLTSDAHQADELARTTYAKLNAERAGVGPERVANCWDAERLRAWAEKKPARLPS